MSHFTKSIVLGITTGILGVIIGILPFGLRLEETIGLDVLFLLRGPQQAPSDVIVVNLDNDSADKLNLPIDSEQWPRVLHAKLLDNLQKAGAKIVAFDILFKKAHTSENDHIFAEAIKKAHNVILVAFIKKEKITSPAGELIVEKLIPPLPLFSEASIALAPHPIPKVPVQVNQYWTFKTTSGDEPTLPVTAFQLFTADVYAELIKFIRDVNPGYARTLPLTRKDLLEAGSLTKTMRILRNMFMGDPSLAGPVLKRIKNAQRLSYEKTKKRMLESLVMMYQSPSSRYLNFYGPPHTISTVSYYDVLQLNQTKSRHNNIDFNGKAVFIGESETFQPEQSDGYYTVYSQPSGVDISGVEIAATAFANLLENKPVQPLSVLSQCIVIMLWGTAAGILCRYYSNLIAGGAVFLLLLLYTITVLNQFMMSGAWFPIVVPLFIQSPAAFFGAILWKYIETNKERQNIKKAFSYYLPDHVVNSLSKNLEDIKANDQLVYGTCLSTDAEHYSSVSESLDPETLRNLMNTYYETVFSPVKSHDGVISNVIADSMLALWVTLKPDRDSNKKACLASMDITAGVNNFNQNSGVSLSTRIGLHSGYIFLGNVGAVDHYEYRPIGDIVNTATRIENFNKYMGTQILISDQVMVQLEGFLTRKLGKFLFVGKSNPLVVHELICPLEKSIDQQHELCHVFSDALTAFTSQLWTEASAKFNKISQTLGKDGPTQYYLNLCEQYKKSPYKESWEGVVQLHSK